GRGGGGGRRQGDMTEGPGGGEEEVPQGLEGAKALPPDDAAAQSLRRGCGEAAGPPFLRGGRRAGKAPPLCSFDAYPGRRGREEGGELHPARAGGGAPPRRRRTRRRGGARQRPRRRLRPARARRHAAEAR